MKVKNTYLVKVKAEGDEILFPDTKTERKFTSAISQIRSNYYVVHTLYETKEKVWYLENMEITALQASGLILRTKNLMLK